MTERIELTVDPRTAADDALMRVYISTKMDIDVNRIRRVDIVRRSIDARQRNIKVNLAVIVHIDKIDTTVDLARPVTFEPVGVDAPEAIVVGAGPAGLFAALRLIELGVRPIVLERGKDVDSRRVDLAAISRRGIVDNDSNYCFGEGGAGAYSDGKLYTRSRKRGPVDVILNIFHQHGALRDILVDAHPHIGSDRLPAIIKAIRQTIQRCGGVVNFGARVVSVDIEVKDSVRHVAGVTTAEGKSYQGPVILATGHSARDIYHFFADKGLALDAKGIAVGVRLEHPQNAIDRIQYHNPNGRGKYLPAAEYSMLTRVDDRAVYSFCMCPGGYIIPAASAQDELVVNGMSPGNRGTRWANSGMVVEILPEDVEGDDELRMMHYQENIERQFFEDGGSLNAPAQRMTDFVASRPSVSLPSTSYAAGIHPARVDELLPKAVAYRLQKGFSEFGRRHQGFLCADACVIGAETRTSSPVRIPRDETSFMHTEVSGLYPCGEGAGYAGGIVSAAIDGRRCAEALAEALVAQN